MNEMTLTIPVDGHWVVALRSIIGAAGAVAELSLDMIDDLRIAIDEAVDLLTHQMRSLIGIKMVCTVTEHGLTVRLEGIRSKCRQECVPSDPETARLVIGTLVTDMHLEGDSCGIYAVCMKLPNVRQVYEC